jgi:hypothetical protein
MTSDVKDGGARCLDGGRPPMDGVTDRQGEFEPSLDSRYAEDWFCVKCGKRHLPFRKECGNFRRCLECDREALDFARGLCTACYQRALRREKREAKQMIPCAWCGDCFNPTRSDAQYCSDRCRQRAHPATGGGRAIVHKQESE